MDIVFEPREKMTRRKKIEDSGEASMINSDDCVKETMFGIDVLYFYFKKSIFSINLERKNWENKLRILVIWFFEKNCTKKKKWQWDSSKKVGKERHGVDDKRDCMKRRRKGKKWGKRRQTTSVECLWSVNNDLPGNINVSARAVVQVVRLGPCPALPFNLVASFNLVPSTGCFPLHHHAISSFVWNGWNPYPGVLWKVNTLIGNIFDMLYR